MYRSAYQKYKLHVTNLLQGLSPHLLYHNIDHTLDVVKQSQRIAAEEGVTEPKDLYLLQIAALYHDTGFLNVYRNHEQESCRIFLADTQDSSFTEEDKKKITQMIMATHLPQKPNTLLERIICDADLDYLGRSDFLQLGDNLRKEFLAYGVVSNEEEWEERQLSFLQSHTYHTDSSRMTREPVKQENYAGCLKS